MAGVVHVAGVAAVDDHVSSVQQFGKTVDGVVGGLAGGNHHPHDAGGVERGDERLERVDVAARFGGHVVADDLVASVGETLGHVAAHAAESDHSDLHFRFLSQRCGVNDVCYEVEYAMWGGWHGSLPLVIFWMTRGREPGKVTRRGRGA